MGSRQELFVTANLSHLKAKMDESLKENSFVGKGFLILFASTVALIYFQVIETPIDPHALEYKVNPNLKRSFPEILLSPWHSETAHWRMPIANWFYRWWGVNEYTYKLFPLLINFCTLLLIYNWTKNHIGKTEAIIAAFLFGISYYNIWITVWVHFAEFYMFASFLTIMFLMKGWEKDGWGFWWIFAFLNFLNLTNTILPFLFQPAIVFVIFALVWTTFKNESSFQLKLKRKSIQFLTTYLASLIAALVFYQAKGVDFIQNTFDLLTKGEFVDKALLPIATKAYSFNEGSALTNLGLLLKNTFVTLNFENHGWIMGHSFAHWFYCVLFFAGLIRIAQTRKTLFKVLIALFVPPVLVLGLIIGITHGRFLVFILPFYLICVASGFVWLVVSIGKIKLYKPTQEALVYFSAFLLFSWVLGFPKPVWSTKLLDEMFQSEGYPSVRDYLIKNIKENDVILNITTITELRSEGLGDALTLISLPEYFTQFFEKHRMELLGRRKGKVGVWLILNQPLSNKNFDPYYFPVGYQPQLIIQKTGVYLYHGNLNLPDPFNIQNDQVFTTPFWSFFKGYALQEMGNYDNATIYYNKFLKYGINSERAHYNLALMLMNFSYEKSLNEFTKAINILETPTKVPEGVKVETTNVNEHDKFGMAQKASEFKRPLLRYYFLNQNGYKVKHWFKEDLIRTGGRIYSSFYFIPALYIYNNFVSTGNREQFNNSILLMNKGFQIDSISDLAVKLFSRLQENKAPRKIEFPIRYANLLSLYDTFPPLPKRIN